MRWRCCRPSCPARLKGVDVREAPEPATNAAVCRFPGPEPHLVIAVETSREKSPRPSTAPLSAEGTSPNVSRRDARQVAARGVLASMNDSARAPARATRTLCYALFDFKRRTVVFANSGPVSGAQRRPSRKSSGVWDRLRSSRRSVSPAPARDVFVFCWRCFEPTTRGRSSVSNGCRRSSAIVRSPRGTSKRFSRRLRLRGEARAQYDCRGAEDKFSQVASRWSSRPRHD